MHISKPAISDAETTTSQMLIGLTGPTGSGKSLASPVAAEFGFRVIDCDQTARRAVEKGMPGLAALTAAFGNGILNPDGTLDRRTLANRAFVSPEQTALLNQTLMPHIITLVLEEAGKEDALLDAPTLFESGLQKKCAATIAVLADPSLRLRRIIERDGLTKQEAELRLHAGKSDDFYRQNADYVLMNNGDSRAFISAFREIMKTIKRNG